MTNNRQAGRQDKRAEMYKTKYNFRAVYALEKLTKQIEKNNVLEIFSAMVDYRKNKWILIIDTKWKDTEHLAYRYYWEKGILTIMADNEIIEEKVYSL